MLDNCIGTNRIHTMATKLTYWMEYESRWSYWIIEVPPESVESFRRTHPTAKQLMGEETIKYIQEKLNE
jgi:hypothetical protein